jgi:hypothetical protein
VIARISLLALGQVAQALELKGGVERAKEIIEAANKEMYEAGE